MPTGTILLIVIGAAALLLIIGLISIFNELVKKRILTQEATGGIGACLQERNDLIPNLVETVKGYAGHENKTLEEVTKWRNQSVAAGNDIEKQNEVATELNAAIMNMMAVSEAYPELKADGHFLQLMQELSRIEGKINDSRRYYNGTVREYNQAIAVFPKNIVAVLFGHKPAVFFAEEVAARVAPKVKFEQD
ncbi:MAG: LemA family protein [Chitinophagaceae bacterium]|nr:LemA family protein [Chitinophagaceae bacterium]